MGVGLRRSECVGSSTREFVAGRPSETDPGEDAEPQKQGLQAADVLLPDHVDFHEGGPLAGGHKAVGLEDALEIGRDDGRGAVKSCAGTAHVEGRGRRFQAVDERSSAVLAVEPGPPAVQAGVLSRHRALVPVCAREHSVDGGGHPGQFVVVDRHGLDGQRAVRAGVLPDESVGLQPAGERSLGDLTKVDLSLAEAVPPVPLEPVAGDQRARLHEPAHAVAAAAPDQVVGGDVEDIAGLRVQPQHVPYAVGLGRHDAGHPTGVVHLGADRVVVDQLADRHEAARGADQGVVRLARADLLRGGGADVEPDRRVEAEHLVQQHPGQLVLEDLGVLGRREVAVVLPARR